jgi:SsrA-binding protein
MAKKKPDKSSATPTIDNRRARHDYHILETLEVGIILHGSEVKSVRASNISLREGYVSAREHPLELTLHNVSIGEYQPSGANQHSMGRVRKLLAHKRETKKLARMVDQKGMTIVPLKLYFKNGYAKLLIGVGQGKASHDKRHSIAEREHKRDMDRAMSKRM